MNRGSIWSTVIISFLVVAVLIIPQYAKATVQTQVTEIANFGPAESNNNRTDNLANDTIALNYDSWDPLPQGMFVGGNIQESEMQLREYAIGVVLTNLTVEYSEFQMCQPIKFSREYILSGSSQFVVRVPIDMESTPPLSVTFEMYKLDSVDDWQPMMDELLDVRDLAGAVLHYNCWGILTAPFPSSPSSWAYVRDGRAYFQIQAPIHPDQWYLLVTHCFYPADSRWNFYLNPADVGSDNSTTSTVTYRYQPAADINTTHTYTIPADLGYSFVFQAGLGINAVGYERLFSAGEMLEFDILLPTGTNPWIEDALNFVMEFRVNSSLNLTWGLKAVALVNGSSRQVLQNTYWTGMVHDSMIVASNPNILNYTATSINGIYYSVIRFTVYIEVAQRAQFVLYDMAESTVYRAESPYQRLYHRDGAGNDLETIFFQPWATASFDNRSLNWTSVTPEHNNQPGFWEGVGNWFSEHWMDILAVVLIVGALIAAPFTFGGSLILLSFGVGVLLYENWPTFRGFVNGLVQGLLDGLTAIGNWLYKIGEMIWKTLTWFIDQIVSYGGQVLALIIYGLAVLIPIIIITMSTKLLSVFFKIAKGDLEGAAKEGKELIGTATMGKYGGG
jgi:hypothetical protein